MLAGACSSSAPTPADTTPPKTVVLGTAKGTATPAPAVPGVNVPAIKVDTVGYPTKWAKIAILNVEASSVEVVDERGVVVATIGADHIAARGVDEASGDTVWQVDLSSVTTPGVYTLRAADQTSDPFRIGKGVYDKAIVAGLKSFYFQRTRTALTEPYAVWEGVAYTRKTASHTHKDVGWDLEDHPAKKRKWDVDAGWHDAGNFDMYVPSTAPTAQALMMAYEWAPERFKDGQLNIPESGNGAPDILDETRWGLRWVLSMQDKSGAFRHREAVMKWSPEGPADEDKTERWIAGPSTSATAKAVAALAMASRVYSDVDPKFARKCAAAAKRGWKFLQANPNHIRAENKGAEQPLWDDEPENNDVGARFVAAVEMWRTFRDDAALASVKKLMADAEQTQPKAMMTGAWANVSRYGLATLATDPETPKALRTEARARIIAGADLVMERVEKLDGYRCASAPADYYWAHNSNLMEKTHVLALAAKLAGKDGARYLAAARDQWHWMLGRNPNGYSMTTGVGKGPDRLYHMEWGKREPPPPGFLLGGPNGQNMGFLAPGTPAKALLWDNPEPLRSGLPAHSMWHWQQSDLWDGGFVAEGQWTDGWWAVTEPDILYSAAFVLAGVSVQ